MPPCFTLLYDLDVILEAVSHNFESSHIQNTPTSLLISTAAFAVTLKLHFCGLLSCTGHLKSAGQPSLERVVIEIDRDAVNLDDPGQTTRQPRRLEAKVYHRVQREDIVCVCVCR